MPRNNNGRNLQREFVILSYFGFCVFLDYNAHVGLANQRACAKNRQRVNGVDLTIHAEHFDVLDL